jgi:hypothetical protein
MDKDSYLCFLVRKKLFKPRINEVIGLLRTGDHSFVSVGLQGFYILTPDPDRLANRRSSPTSIQLYKDYYSASLGYGYIF